MGRHPAPTPLPHSAISGASRLSDLLVTLLRMLVGGQNDPNSHDEGLGRAGSSQKMFKLLGFRSRELNGITGMGTAHFLSPPPPSLSVLVHPVKLGKYL